MERKHANLRDVGLALRRLRGGGGLFCGAPGAAKAKTPLLPCGRLHRCGAIDGCGFEELRRVQTVPTPGLCLLRGDRGSQVPYLNT